MILPALTTVTVFVTGRFRGTLPNFSVLGETLSLPETGVGVEVGVALVVPEAVAVGVAEAAIVGVGV